MRKLFIVLCVLALSGCALSGRYIDDRAESEIKIIRGDVYCQHGRRKAFVYILESEGGVKVQYITEQKLHAGDVLRIVKVEEVD